MRRILLLLIALAAGPVSAQHLHDIVLKGSTDRSVTVKIIDSTDGTPETGVVFNTTGIDLWYRREGAVSTDVTEATLASLSTAHADGGFLHVNDGIYRLDLPDAAFATGANYVDFGGTVTGMIVVGGRVRLVDYDLETARPTNHSLLSIDGSGRIDVGSVGGTAQTANDNGADINAILVDTGTTLDTHLTDIKGGTFSGATDSLEAIRDRGDAAWTTGSGTGLTAIATGTAQSATGTTLVLASGETFADDELIGAVVQITGGSTGVGQTRCISDNTGSNDTITVPTWTTTPTGTITYEIAPSLGGECPLSTGSATQLNVTASGNVGIDWANVENATSSVALTGTTTGLIDNAITAAKVATDAIGSDEIAANAIGASELAADAIGASELAAGAVTELQTGLATSSALSTHDGKLDTVDANVDSTLADTDALETRLTAARAQNLDVLTAQRTAFLNCEVNTANFAGNTTTLACILTDIDDGAVTQATGDLEGLELYVTSGAQIREARYITDSTWDGANSELQLTLSRALPGTLADAVTAVIR